MQPVNRRLFLFSAVVAPLYPAAPLTVLSPEEAKLIEALCDQIIPADEVPGARQAGVLYYIDKQLAGPLKRCAEAYHQGIPQFRSTCKERNGEEFYNLNSADQVAFLRAIDAGELAALKPFFVMVIDHTMQGFYGSPAHGGNRGEVSWQMLGIDEVMGGHGH